MLHFQQSYKVSHKGKLKFKHIRWIVVAQSYMCPWQSGLMTVCLWGHNKTNHSLIIQCFTFSTLISFLQRVQIHLCSTVVVILSHNMNLGTSTLFLFLRNLSCVWACWTLSKVILLLKALYLQIYSVWVFYGLLETCAAVWQSERWCKRTTVIFWRHGEVGDTGSDSVWGGNCLVVQR